MQNLTQMIFSENLVFYTVASLVLRVGYVLVKKYIFIFPALSTKFILSKIDIKLLDATFKKLFLQETIVLKKVVNEVLVSL